MQPVRTPLLGIWLLSPRKAKNGLQFGKVPTGLDAGRGGLRSRFTPKATRERGSIVSIGESVPMHIHCRLHGKPATKALAALIALMLLWPASAWALSRDDILLYAPMDAGGDATIARGDPKARVYGKLEFAEGKTGRGYMSGGPECALGYFSAGNIDPDAGAVAMWVKPVGWSHSRKSKEPNMRWWFRAGEADDGKGYGEGSFLWLYKLKAHVPVYWLVQHDYRQRSFYYTGFQHEWKDGQWTHIAGTWCGPEMRLFVNGRMTGSARTPTPKVLRNFGRRFYIGAPSWSKRPDCVIDDVFVLRRPITEAECRALAEHGFKAFTMGEFPPKLDLQAAFFPSVDRLKMKLMINGRRPGDVEGLSVSLTVRNRDTARPTKLDADTRSVKAVNSEELLDTSELPPGNYELVAALVHRGKVVSLNSADFEKPDKPEWLGNRIGVADKAPAPWTPIVRKGDSLECWGRKVIYAGSLLPARIASRGKELLARPIALVAERNGRAVRPTGVKLKWTDVTPLRARFEAVARLGDLKVRASGWMEYDGFIWTKISIPAAPKAEIARLRLEIPLRPEIATLQHGGLRMHFKPRDGKVHAWKFPILWQPFIWLGNEDAGLQWSTDNDYSWRNAKPDETVSLTPGKDEVLLTVSFIDHPVKLDGPLEYAFGLHATPVKPLPRDWRRYDAGFNCARITLGKPSRGEWAIFYQKWNAQTAATPKGVFGYQAAGPGTRELIKGTNADGVRPLLYWNVNTVWRAAPAYRAFRSEWEPNNPPALPFETCGKTACGRVWRTERSFQDWAIWRYHKTLKDNPWLVDGIAGFYNDVVQGFWGVEPRVDSDGLVQTRHELLGVRELQKRFYVFVQNEFPGKVLVNHQSGDTHMSQLAFAHAYVTGENFRGRPEIARDLGYYNALDLDQCRATLLGSQWGVPVVFLPEVWGNNTRLFKKAVSSKEGLAGARHLAGLLLAHDVIPWMAYVHPLPFVRVAAMKQQFGWDEKTAFTGYWKSSSLVGMESDKSPVVVSVFTRPGKAMFVVMNNSDEDARVSLRPNWGKLGLAAPKKLLDGLTAPGIPDGKLDVRKYGQGKLIFNAPEVQRETVYVALESGKVDFRAPKRDFRALIAQ